MRLTYSFLALLYATQTFCLPLSPSTSLGSVEFHYLNPTTLEICTSDQSTIDWSEFSIQTGELVRFLQPRAQSLVINRVRGEGPTEIFGAIESNGKVVLLNPLGILIGKESQINVGSFIASTLEIQDEKSGMGSLVFSGNSSAAIDHYGSIKTNQGPIYLLGPKVNNLGILHAEGGSAGLIASSKIEIASDTSMPIAEFSPHQKGICLHSGLLESMFGTDTGGTAIVWGDEVTLASESKINVSAAHKGGSVWIGKMRNDSQSRDQLLIFETGAMVSADAYTIGDGGEILIWSEGTNLYHGFVSARAGMDGGDGGNIEISAPTLRFEGLVDLVAPNGTTGTLTLDPLDVTISAAANANVTGASPYTPTAVGANLNATTVTTALGSANVVITTVGTPAGGNGDIFVNAPLLWTSNFSLTLTAARDINIANNADIRCQGLGNGSVTLDAVGNINILADVRNANSLTGGGVSGSVSVTSQSGDITIGSATQTRNVSVCARKGTTTVTANTGNITILGGNAINAFSAIGESSQTPIGGGGPSPIASGPINVSCAQNLNMISGSIRQTYTLIGKGGTFQNTTGSGLFRSVDATDITVTVGGDMTMLAGPFLFATGGNPDSYIANAGYQSASGSFNARNGNIELNVHGNLLMRGQGASSYIGLGSRSTVGNGRCQIFLRVGGNMTVDSTAVSNTFNGVFSYGDPPLRHTMNVLGYIGGNLTLDGRNQTAIFRCFNNSSVASIAPQTILHIGGEFNLLSEVVAKLRLRRTFAKV